jgi:hypothetical protein
MVTGNKIKAHTELIDESIDQKSFDQLCLSIQVSNSTFCYSIIDWSNSKQLLLKDYHFDSSIKNYNVLTNLEVVYSDNPILNKPFKKISVSIVNNTYTIVPAPFFDSNEAEVYLKLNCKLQNDDFVLYSSMKNMNAYCIFAMDKKIKSFFDFKHTGVKYLHQAMVLNDALLNNFKNNDQTHVIANIRQSEFDLVVLKNKKTEMINSFSYTNADDLLFHLLYACEQLSINPDKQEILISGEILKNSAIFEKMSKYIRHVRFISRNNSIAYSYKFNDVPEHFYYTSLNQYQEF